MKKMNNKGITLLELIVSFAIVGVAAVYFYQTLVTVSKLYSNARTKTNDYTDYTYALRLIDDKYNDLIEYNYPYYFLNYKEETNKCNSDLCNKLQEFCNKIKSNLNGNECKVTFNTTNTTELTLKGRHFFTINVTLQNEKGVPVTKKLYKENIFIPTEYRYAGGWKDSYLGLFGANRASGVEQRNPSASDNWFHRSWNGHSNVVAASWAGNYMIAELPHPIDSSKINKINYELSLFSNMGGRVTGRSFVYLSSKPVNTYSTDDLDKTLKDQINANSNIKVPNDPKKFLSSKCNAKSKNATVGGDTYSGSITVDNKASEKYYIWIVVKQNGPVYYDGFDCTDEHYGSENGINNGGSIFTVINKLESIKR